MTVWTAGEGEVLRNHPTCAVRTRERIQQLSAKVGYRPDPMLSRLMQQPIMPCTGPARQAPSSLPKRLPQYRLWLRP
jgi:hypothetical protein